MRGGSMLIEWSMLPGKQGRQSIGWRSALLQYTCAGFTSFLGCQRMGSVCLIVDSQHRSRLGPVCLPTHVHACMCPLVRAGWVKGMLLLPLRQMEQLHAYVAVMVHNAFGSPAEIRMDMPVGREGLGSGSLPRQPGGPPATAPHGAALEAIQGFMVTCSKQRDQAWQVKAWRSLQQHTLEQEQLPAGCCPCLGLQQPGGPGLCCVALSCPVL